MTDHGYFVLALQQIVEYDVLESLKTTRGLVIAFHKRIFQTAIPVSMTLIYNTKAGEDQLLIADSDMKFRLFDKSTFEILASFLGPIYDSHVQQFVSIYGTTIQIEVDGLKAPLSFFYVRSFFFFFLIFYVFLRPQTRRLVSRLMQISSFSPLTKIFVFSLCPSTAIPSGALALSDIVGE